MMQDAFPFGDVAPPPRRRSIDDAARAYAHAIAPSADREENDFYPTPPEGTEALLSVEAFPGGRIWEPACGDGAMSAVLARAHEVVSTDLIDRGFGLPGVDFLDRSIATPDGVAHIVTNPPFRHAEAFARHALERATHKVALLCRLAWLEGQGRRDLFTTTPLRNVWVFAKRLRIQRGRLPTADDGAGMTAYAWFVWDKQHPVGEPPRLGWI